MMIDSAIDSAIVSAAVIADGEEVSAKVKAGKILNKKRLHYLELQESHLIVVSKFNGITLMQNDLCRGGNKKECLYGSITCLRYKQRNLLVLELNVETNLIVGLGLIRNIEKRKERHSPIYENELFNTFIYRGVRIDCSEFTENEARLMQDLETCCCRGHHHIKRGNRIVMFPFIHIDRMEREKQIDLVMELRKMFQSRFV